MLENGFLGSLQPSHLYAALFLLLLVEGVGVPFVPFEPAFLAAGLMIATGRMSLLAATLVGAAGNLAGNLIGYRLGRDAARLLANRPWLGVDLRRLREVERWFHRYGALTTFIARFFGLIRTPAILGAGLARMNFWSYLVWSALGGTLWCLAWLAASTFLGAPVLELARRWAGWTALLAGLALAVAAWYGYRQLSRRRLPSA